MTGYDRAVLKNAVKPSDIVVIDQMQAEYWQLMLSYEDYRDVKERVLAKSAALCNKIHQLFSTGCFLMLPQDEKGKINGYTLLEYVYKLQLSITIAKAVNEYVVHTDGSLSEHDYIAMITLIQKSAQTHLEIDVDFQEYYELICTRLLVLQHERKQHNPRTGKMIVGGVDAILECPLFSEFYRLMDPAFTDVFDRTSNRFHPQTIRYIHRQYLQLDSDKNGMLSGKELLEYGKKKAFNPTYQQPTHDLTEAFITQVLNEWPTYPPDNEMDYRGYLDFTVLMADTRSTNALRFLWNILDFQKQGFLDAFSIDFFLRDIIAKIRSHDSDDMHTTVEKLRTQIFDLVAPVHPSRITWADIKHCKLGHVVLRLMVDYMAFRSYEDSSGRFAVIT